MKKIIAFILSAMLMCCLVVQSFAITSKTTYEKYSEKNGYFVGNLISENNLFVYELGLSSVEYTDINRKKSDINIKENSVNLKKNALYNIDKTTGEIVLVSDRKYSHLIPISDGYVCVKDDIEIVKLSPKGDYIASLYIGDFDIIKMVADDETIFFWEDNTVYKYHMPTKTLSKIKEDKDMIDFRPFKINLIAFYYENEEFTECMDIINNSEDYAETVNILSEKYDVPISVIESYDYLEDFLSEYLRLTDTKVLFYDSITNTYSESLSLEDSQNWEDAVDKKFPVEQAENSSMSVSAAKSSKGYPFSEYPNGSFFSKNGKKCECHPGCGGSGNGSCNCKVFNGSSQCAGFAFYVYNKTFNRTPGAKLSGKSFNNASEVKSYIRSLYNGSILRVYSVNGHCEHSLVIDDISETSVKIYHANVDDPCKVRYQEMTYSNFYNRYSKVMHAYNGVTSSWGC